MVFAWSDDCGTSITELVVDGMFSEEVLVIETTCRPQRTAVRLHDIIWAGSSFVPSSLHEVTQKFLENLTLIS